MTKSPLPSAVNLDAGLLRVIGFWALSASIINLTIAGAIFVLPGTLASTLGAAAPLVFVLGALIFVPITLCFSAAGSRVAGTGGPYYYVRAAFGPFLGFVVGVVFWISNVAGSGSVASALIDQLARLVPLLGEPVARATLVASAYAGLCAVNARGIRVGAVAITVLAAIKLLPLIALVVIGPFHIRSGNLTGQALLSWSSVGSAMVMVIFAYSGIENALSPSGEVSDPSRVVPRAALVAVGIVVLLYVGLQFIAQGILGRSLAGNTAPLAAVAGAVVPGTYDVLLVTASISMFGLCQGDLVGSSRLIYAIARDGFLPAPLARVTAKHRVPLPAIIAHAFAVCALTIQGGFESLALMSGGAFCLVYLAVCAAAWQLQRKGISECGAPFTLPGGGALPLFACLGLSLVLLTLKRAEWIAIGYCLCPMLLLYGAVRVRTMHQGSPS